MEDSPDVIICLTVAPEHVDKLVKDLFFFQRGICLVHLVMALSNLVTFVVGKLPLIEDMAFR